MFIAGIAIMAATVGVPLGWNPLQWRSRFDDVIARLNRSPWFWLGLVINTLGAAGSALVVVTAIAYGLPMSAWGLLVLPFLDLAVTVAVRAAIVSGVTRR